MNPDYIYRATVVQVMDGDSALLNVAVGFYITVRVNARLAGVNARELHQDGGPEARDHLTGYLPAGDVVTIRSIKPDKFAGRWDTQITSALGVDVSAAMVDDGYAALWNGQGPKPVPPWPPQPQPTT